GRSPHALGAGAVPDRALLHRGLHRIALPGAGCWLAAGGPPGELAGGRAHRRPGRPDPLLRRAAGPALSGAVVPAIPVRVAPLVSLRHPRRPAPPGADRVWPASRPGSG